MFEKLIEKILRNYFGIFFSGLDRKNLKLSLWFIYFYTFEYQKRNGKAVLKNVNLQPDVTELFGLPLIIKFSTVGSFNCIIMNV